MVVVDQKSCRFDNDNQKDPVKLDSFENSRLFTAKIRISSSHTVTTTCELMNVGQIDQQSQDVLTRSSKVDSRCASFNSNTPTNVSPPDSSQILQQHDATCRITTRLLRISTINNCCIPFTLQDPFSIINTNRKICSASTISTYGTTRSLAFNSRITTIHGSTTSTLYHSTYSWQTIPSHRR